MKTDIFMVLIFFLLYGTIFLTKGLPIYQNWFQYFLCFGWS